MTCLNKVILIGNLGRDPEVRYTTTGRVMASLSLATSENWKDDNGEWKESTQWHRVVLWGPRAESLKERLTKGCRVFVEGQMRTRSWEDESGKKRYFTEVKAQRLFPLSSQGNGSSGTLEAVEDETGKDAVTVGDTPF